MNDKVSAKIPALSTEQMKEVDRLMVQQFGIELIQMMENAGRSLAELARRLTGGRVLGKSIIVLCGTGNNGGGGMVAARHLHNWGAQAVAPRQARGSNGVQVVLIGDAAQLKKVPARQWKIIEKLGLNTIAPDLKSADLILDALLGYGAQGDPRPPVSDWIERANASGVPILSLDSPSGLDTTTGEPGKPCVRAEATMTLALPKTGLLTSQARPFVGKLYLTDIGVPPELYAAPSLGFEVNTLFAEGAILQVV
ncbi:MAG TPA: NAD(P)H-hydrate epimerase [Anaerolineales bacterium]